MKYKTTMEEPAGSAARVAEELRRLGIAGDIKEMPESTRSASDAAAAIGCDVSEIVKSLVFRAVERDDPVLVLAPGSARVDEFKLGGGDRGAGRAGHRQVRPGADRIRHRRGRSCRPLCAAGHIHGPVAVRPRGGLGGGGHTELGVSDLPEGPPAGDKGGGRQSGGGGLREISPGSPLGLVQTMIVMY